MYCPSNEEYSDLLQSAIASKHKKPDKYTEANINKEGNKHAREANIIDSIEISGAGNSFIMLKGNKKK